MFLKHATKFFNIHQVEVSDGVKPDDPYDNFVIKDKKDNILGYINFYPPWKRWVFTTKQEGYCIFDVKCLEEIIKFIKDRGNNDIRN